MLKFKKPSPNVKTHLAYFAIWVYIGTSIGLTIKFNAPIIMLSTLLGPLLLGLIGIVVIIGWYFTFRLVNGYFPD